MNSPEDTFDLSFRVVVYNDDGNWAAHALELDIVGAGETPDEAMSELISAIECQVTFALQSGDPSLMDHEAPPEIIALWEEAKCNSVRTIFAGDASRSTRPARAVSASSSDGPLAKFYGLTGEKLEDLRNHPMELVCG